MTDSDFSWPVRVYYEDTDAGGVVYHANYLGFMERARNEWLRDLGHPILKIAEELNLIFVLRHLDIAYRAPARLDDLLSVTATIINAERASLTLKQQVMKGEQCLVEAEVALVMVDATTFRPKRLPDFLQQPA